MPESRLRATKFPKCWCSSSLVSRLRMAPLSSRCLRAGVLASLLMSSGPEVHAAVQRPVVLSRDICQECDVSLMHVVTLGDLDGPGAIGPLSTIAMMADGRYAVGSDVSDSEIVVFSPDGRTATVIGREGDGPGEFRFVRWVRTFGGNLHVFDARARRHTVFSPHLQVFRTSSFMGSPLGGVVVVNDSTVVMNSHIRTRERVGFLLHVFDGSGNLTRSFAEEQTGYRFEAPGATYWRAVSSSSRGGVWSARMTSYRIDEWSLDGTLLRSFAGGAPWFVEHDGRSGAPDPSKPPPPRILDIHEDGQDRLWVMIRVASPEWSDALRPSGSGAHPEMGAFTIDDLNRAYDTIIEVIHVPSGSVVVSSRLQPALIEFVGADQVVSTTEDSYGVPRLDIWRVSLHQPGRFP
jgi:hypothetical protein